MFYVVLAERTGAQLLTLDTGLAKIAAARGLRTL
jgi:predicted nucleic acid-binding protein